MHTPPRDGLPRDPARSPAAAGASGWASAGGGPLRRGPLPRAADARTLYLAAAERLRVTSTGEALVIGRPDAPHLGAQRIPVARVLRIVCGDSAEWSGAALALCQQRGITITWLNGRGEAAGHLWPERPRRVDLADALNVLAADDPGWSDAYRHWLRHQRLAVLQTWQAERGAAGQPVREAEWQEAKRRWVYRDEPPELLPALLHGLAAALVTHRLSECGLLPHYWCCVGEPVELAHDLTRLIWAEMNYCAGPLAAAVDQPREAAAIFERWSGRCVGALHQHLANLRAHALRELAC
ncbi:MAG: CRISPR-associated endonuclease Cas1 [Burkholderiaceae bacterium]|nr:CRISPR-associated endonuclease Cas1 [Burkholderiaceae bacterium]